MSIERVVAVLTPLFGAASGWVTGWVANHFPGLPAISPGDVTAIEIAGFSGAVAAALKWLHGRQKFVAFTDEAKQTLEDALAKVRATLAQNPQAGLAVADIEQLLRTHEASIEQAIDHHVPAAVGQALQALFAQLGTGGQSSTSQPPAAPTGPAPGITGGQPTAP